MPGWRVEQQANSSPGTELTNAWASEGSGEQPEESHWGLAWSWLWGPWLGPVALGPVALEVGLETAGLEAGFDQTLLLVIKSY